MPLRKLSELTNTPSFTEKLNRPDPLTPNGPSARTGLPPLRKPAKSDSSETGEVLIKTSRLVRDSFFTYLLPDLVEKPTLLCASKSALKLLDIHPKEFKTPEFVQILAGNKLLSPDCQPFCHIYGGHQFGIYSGQLGDGRCTSIAEIQNSSGECFELQLKGTGRTPYSRNGDGKCTLADSVREFLACEYMAALGIPTTRALGIVATNTLILRNGHSEPAAIVCRFSKSFVRFGTFELFYHRGDKKLLQKLADYCIEAYYPYVEFDPSREEDIPELRVDIHLRDRETSPKKKAQMENLKEEVVKVTVRLNKYARLFQNIVRRTANLIG
jgi:uncharacterized protein YdiU (UPF0061 family)